MSAAASIDLLRAGLVAARERKRNLDLVSLLSAAIAFGCVAGLWFLRLLDLDLAAPARFSFAYLTTYVVASLLTDRLEQAPALNRASQLLQLSLVPYLALLWHLVGGVDNPIFLLVFFLPVAASGATLSRWQPHLIAATGSLLVGVLAAAGSPDLRWHLERLGLRLETPATVLAELLPPRPTPFPGLTPEPGFLLVLLLSFVVLLFSGAFVAHSLTRVLLRMAHRLQVSVDNLEEVSSLFQAILKAEPEPGVVVYADSGQVVQASDRFLQRMLLSPEDPIGKTVFDLIRFSQPERVRALLARGQGEASFCVYEVGKEARIANLTVHSVQHGAATYAYIGFKDLTESYYLNAAFDAISEPVLVIGGDGRLRYSNRAAEDVFGALYFNLDVGPLLATPGLAADWWRNPSPDSPPRMEFGERVYRVSSIEAPLPDESGGATILTLRDVSEEEKLLEEATIDPVTGVYNRHFFEDSLPQHIGLAGRGEKVALAVLVLDDLDRINRELGHAAGDETLRRCTRATRIEIRMSDVLGRLGGNRFGVLFTETAPHEASIVIDRINRRLERMPLVVPGRTLAIRMSASAVAVQPGDTPGSLIARADRLLQSAQPESRGQCLVQI